MAANNANYDDERLTALESDKSEALSDLEETYADMAKESDDYYGAQIDASKQWAEKQTALQNKQTDFAIDQIEQQKEQAEKDYQKEQSGAYVDWQKQSNAYGVSAEKTAAAGLAGSGYSETMQVGMYNTYQQRVAAARESFNLAVLNYNNAIKDARLQNNSALAQIAYEALQTQLELSLAGFQYKNQLLLELSDKKLAVEDTYHSRYMDVLDAINSESALEEEIRQFNANYELQVREYEEGVRQYNEEIARLKENDAKAHLLEIQQLELKRQELLEEKAQFEAQMTEEKRQYDTSLSEERRQYDASLAEEKRQFNADAAEEARQFNESLTLEREQAAQNQTRSAVIKDEAAVEDEEEEIEYTEAMTRFEKLIMTKKEFMQRGKQAYGKVYNNYDEYLIAAAKKWCDEGKLNDDEFANLLIAHELGDKYVNYDA